MYEGTLLQELNLQSCDSGAFKSAKLTFVHFSQVSGFVNQALVQNASQFFPTLVLEGRTLRGRHLVLCSSQHCHFLKVLRKNFLDIYLIHAILRILQILRNPSVPKKISQAIDLTLSQGWKQILQTL